jgi:sialidase-1
MLLFDNNTIPGYARFRIPGIVASVDGTLLAYCEARKTDDDWADIDILLRISHDGGRTFSEPAVLASCAKEGKTVNNPVMIASRDGSLHFLYCVEYGLETAGGGVFYRKSTDDGAIWSEPRDISAMTSPELRNVFATGPGHGIELADGTLFVPCWTVLKKHCAEPHSHHPGSVCCLVLSG